MRELQAAAENGFLWAITLQNHLKELLELKNKDQLDAQSYEKTKTRIEHILNNSLNEILKDRQKQLQENRPTSKTQQKTSALVKRIKAHLSEFLAFAEHKKGLVMLLEKQQQSQL